jgi:hypothetical protein
MSTKLTFSQKQKKKHRQHNKGDFHCKLFFSFPELSRKVEKLENRLRKLSGSLKVVEDSEVDHAVLADLRHDLDRMAETILFLKDRCGKGKNKNLQSQKIDFIRSSFDEKFKRWREQQVCRECFCVDNKMILSQLYSHNFVDFRLLSLASIITPPPIWKRLPARAIIFSYNFFEQFYKCQSVTIFKLCSTTEQMPALVFFLKLDMRK